MTGYSCSSASSFSMLRPIFRILSSPDIQNFHQTMHGIFLSSLGRSARYQLLDRVQRRAFRIIYEMPNIFIPLHRLFNDLIILLWWYRIMYILNNLNIVSILQLFGILSYKFIILLISIHSAKSFNSIHSRKFNSFKLMSASNRTYELVPFTRMVFWGERFFLFPFHRGMVHITFHEWENVCS